MKRLLPFLVLATVAAGGPQDKPIADDNNAFATDLFAQLRAKDGNLFFSPYSLSTALAMTYAGARGTTAEEMAKTMHFTLKDEKLHKAFAAQIADFNGEGAGRGYTLSVANALWGQNGLEFRKEFCDLVEKSYGAGLERVDFAGATEEARKTINAWVEKKTNEKIKDLLAAGVLTSDTRLVLTNAIYFKGDWETQFKKTATADADFHFADGKTAKVPTMYQKTRFGHAVDGDLQILSMPYKGKELSMVVLLPKDVAGLRTLEEGLTAEKLAGWIGKLRPGKVDVYLPKFKMTCEFSVGDALKAMGMRSAFAGGADFSGMTDRESFFISAVIHKAFVDVNEEGTEAAAATAVTMDRTAAPREIVFRADRPFLFAIRHDKTGAILFMGRVADPRG